METRLTYIVDIEEESIVDVLRGSLVSDPVKLVYKNGKISIVNKMSKREGEVPSRVSLPALPQR